MVCESRLARPILGLSRQMSVTFRAQRVAVLPITESAFARPEVVDISTYKYPGNPSYPGLGPKAIPEQWETEERCVHYCIPKTFHEFLSAKLGQTGIYTIFGGGTIAFLSKETLVPHVETKTGVVFFFAVAAINMLGGNIVREKFEEEYTNIYDKFYACKEHDIAAYTEIVGKYKDAQDQAQGQALFNQQKLTNLALMLETEYLQRQNSLVDSVTKKLNYQVAVQNALEDQEKNHMINWIESQVNAEVAKIDQDEMIRVCVDNLKKQ
jgi:hypothetical protein